MAYSEEHKKNIKQRALFFYDTETGKQVIIPIHAKLLGNGNYDCHKIRPNSKDYIGYLPKITQLQNPLLQKWAKQVSEKVVQHYKEHYNSISQESSEIIIKYKRILVDANT
ncbi:MAG: hypothetical protein EP298_10500 [Gammaproteobacteria bacterium]|nr:MAG: hypothetical protein EP298_10500 [Gammaproteobacteria bacterium]UTW42202.1 hypothetical protein KFE69_12020 [bacterium SCSIO 12844]